MIPVIAADRAVRIAELDLLPLRRVELAAAGFHIAFRGPQICGLQWAPAIGSPLRRHRRRRIDAVFSPFRIDRHPGPADLRGASQRVERTFRRSY